MMFPAEIFRDTLSRLLAILSRFAVRFHLTGAITSVAYGEPRMTQDIDIVVDNPALAGCLDAFVAAVSRHRSAEKFSGDHTVGSLPPREMLAVLRSGDGGSEVVVLDPETGVTIGEFRPFDRVTAGTSLVDVANLDGDGSPEVVALQVDREMRMRAFSTVGDLLEETIIKPFGNRRVRDLDMTLGDLDGDGRSEMVFAGRTARGFEIRAMDAATLDAEMPLVLRGMAGAPQVVVDDATDRMSVVGRSVNGGLMLATVTDDGVGTPDASRTLPMSAREMRKLARAHGGLAEVSLIATDVDGDGTTETMVGMSFRDGSMRAVTGDETGVVAMMADPIIHDSPFQRSGVKAWRL